MHLLSRTGAFATAVIFFAFATRSSGFVQLVTDAGFYVDEPNNYRTDYQDESGTTGPLTSSVIDPVAGKARGIGFADFGRVGAAAEIDPDIGGYSLFASGSGTFADDLLVSGDNLGQTATAIVRFHVRGILQQPFFVSEVTGYAEARLYYSAGSDLGGDSIDVVYSASGMGSPIVNVFNEIKEVTVPFVVGDTISVGKTLDAVARAEGLNVAPDVETFAALFDSTVELLPIVLVGVDNPTITSESGTVYAFVPEPGSVAMLAVAALAGLGRQRRSGKVELLR